MFTFNENDNESFDLDLAASQQALFGDGYPDHQWRATSVDAAELLWLPLDPMALFMELLAFVAANPDQNIGNLIGSITRTTLDHENDLKDHEGYVPIRLDDFVGVTLVLAALARVAMTREDDPMSVMIMSAVSVGIQECQKSAVPQTEAIVARLKAEGLMTDEDEAKGRAYAEAWASEHFGTPSNGE